MVSEQQASAVVRFPDPAEYSSIPVYDLLRAAARGYVGIDRRFIRAIIDRGEAAAADLLRFGLEDREDDRVDLEEDLIAMFRHLGSACALPFFIACVRRQPDDIPDDVVEGILPFGERAIEPLIEIYEQVGEERGADIAFLLASLRRRDERIFKLLLERLEYDAADGAFCLGLYADPRAKPALEQVLRDIAEEDVELRREIQFAIQQIDAPVASGEIALEPVDIYEHYPERAAPPLDVLSEDERLEMLECGASELRAEAAESFRNQELGQEARERLFERARTDPDPSVRARCWEALASAAREDSRIADAMKTVLNDASREAEEREGALIALAESSDDGEAVQYMREFYGNPVTRAKALDAMWRSFDPQFADYFPRHLDDPDVEIRRAAIRGVGYMRLGSYAGRLRAMFEDENFRPDALFAYALSVPAEISRGRARGLFRKIDDAAGGLSQGEAELVQLALDQRLAMHGLAPVFSDADAWEEEEEQENSAASMPKVGRNDPCPCGSGKKYKKCHGA